MNKFYAGPGFTHNACCKHEKYLTRETLAVAVVTRCGEDANIVSSFPLSLLRSPRKMQRKHSSALRANIKASTSFPQSGTELGDIFICGTAKACSVKDCFKRSTHFHCSLCPDRKVVKVS